MNQETTSSPEEEGRKAHACSRQGQASEMALPLLPPGCHPKPGHHTMQWISATRQEATAYIREHRQTLPEAVTSGEPANLKGVHSKAGTQAPTRHPSAGPHT
jgi:hypothetical protein